MQTMSWLFSAERVLRVCEFITIAAAVLAVLALIGQAIAGRVVTRHEKERADRAEAALQELQERAKPRTFSAKAFTEALKGKAIGTAIIWTDPNTPDAYESIGMVMSMAFTEARWSASLREIPPPPAGSRPPRVRPGIMIEGIVDPSDCDQKDTPSCSLWRALLVSGLEPISASGGTEYGKDLPKDTFRIIVGPRPLLETPPAK
jgi:hypothetical protein